MVDYPDLLPFKLRALRAMTDTLKEIVPANGYHHDVSNAVWRGRAWFDDTDTLPMLSILEGVSPADEVGEPPELAQGGAYDWPLIVQGFVDDDPENPTDPAYLLLADVRRRLAAEKARVAPGTRGQPDPFGLGVAGKNRIGNLTFGSGVVRPADDISNKAYFWMPVVLRITESSSEPYA